MYSNEKPYAVLLQDFQVIFTLSVVPRPAACIGNHYCIELFRLGIFNKVVPHNQLRNTTLEYAKWFAEGPPLALGITRMLVYQGLQLNYEEHLNALDLTYGNLAPDRREAMAAWVEKREPHYEGKGIEM